MTLLDRLETELGIERERAIKALGAIFTSIRMAVDAGSFGAIVTAMPEVSGWLRETPIEPGTGAVLALATPATLARTLTNTGFTNEEIAAMGTLTGRALRETVTPDVVERVTRKLPFIAEP